MQKWYYLHGQYRKDGVLADITDKVQKYHFEHKFNISAYRGTRYITQIVGVFNGILHVTDSMSNEASLLTAVLPSGYVSKIK